MKLGVTASLALAGALASAGFLAIPGSAQATLHGFCSTAAPCMDTGTNTPTSVNPPDFGFSAGGHSATGDLMIDILVPDTISSPSTTYTISGPLVGASTFTATLFSTTPWTRASSIPPGDRRSTLISAYREARNNPIGAYLPSAQTFQPTATGFFVYTADLGTQTLPSNSGASNSDLLTLNKGILQGSYVVAFLDGTNATANSGAIFEKGAMTPVPEPSTWAMMILGFCRLSPCRLSPSAAHGSIRQSIAPTSSSCAPGARKRRPAEHSGIWGDSTHTRTPLGFLRDSAIPHSPVLNYTHEAAGAVLDVTLRRHLSSRGDPYCSETIRFSFIRSPIIRA